MKKLKTGDVKRFSNEFVEQNHRWATCSDLFGCFGWGTRKTARFCKSSHERIARILSIGPKYVTVRISK